MARFGPHPAPRRPFFRNDVDRLTESVFRAENPEIDALLAAQPRLPEGVRSEPQFFVHRQMARFAMAKGTREDAVALDKFLSDHPDIAKICAKARARS